jgi:hypothetical protein
MRKRSPKACDARRTRISGEVSFAATRDINQERRSGARRSIKVHSAATTCGRAVSIFVLIARNIARATMGETLLPIILNECQTVGWKR